MQEKHKGDFPGRNFSLSIVAMPAKEVAIVAGRNLRFGARDWKRLSAQFLQHSGQVRPRSLYQSRARLSQLKQHHGAAIFEIDCASRNSRRNDFTDPKVGLTHLRVPHQSLELGRSEEFVEYYVSRFQ